MNDAVLHTEPSLSHHLFQISIAQGVAAIPAHVKQDNAVLKVIPFKMSGMEHELGIGDFGTASYIIAS